MTKLFTISICSLFLLFSCSSDDDSNDNPDGPVVTVIDESDNSITLDDEEFNFTITNVIRTGDQFVIKLSNEDRESISIPFFRNGNYGNIFYEGIVNGGFELFQTLNVYPSRNFSFEVLNIDEANDRVSISFNGPLFNGSYLSSDEIKTADQIQISASLNLPYETIVPTIEGLDVSAFIDGEEWHSLNSTTSSSGVGFSMTTQSYNNDTEFTINFVLGENEIIPGVYNFDETSGNVSRLFLTEDIFDEDGENTFIEYLSEGILTVESVENSFGLAVLRAQFSFTARNPETNEEIEVTSGILNIVSSSF